MKQYIKKALWIIPFLFSLNLNAGRYIFIGTPGASGYGVGNNTSNWQEATSLTTPSNFNGSHIWDFNGVDVDMAGMSFSSNGTGALPPSFTNGKSSTTSKVINSGTVTFTTRTSAPAWNAGGGNLSLDFSTQGTFVYNNNNTSTGVIQYISDLNYYNLTLSNSTPKSIGYSRVNGTLTTSTSVTGGSVKIQITGQLELASTIVFSAITNTNFESYAPIPVVDSRTSTKIYPGNWYFYYDPTDNVSPNTPQRSDYGYICEGEYSNIYIYEPVTLRGNVTISGSLDFQNTSASGNFSPLELVLNGKSLTFKTSATFTIGSSSNYLIGDNAAEISSSSSASNTGTFYFSATSGENSLKNISLTSGSSLTLGTDVVVESGLTLNSGTLILNGKTLENKGTCTTTNNGKIRGSSTSILKCSHNNNQTYYFDQSSDANKTLKKLDLINSSSATLGSDLILSNSGNTALGFNNSNNYLSLNGKTLTITGNIYYTSTSTEGRFQGSSSSNLTLLSTNSLYFDQTTEENRTLKNLTIDGNSVTVNLGNWLNITGGTSSSSFGTVDVIAASNKLYTGGYLTLKSNQYGTAMIGNVLGTIENSSGNNNETILVENYLPYLKSTGSSKGRQYRFLSSPVSDGKFRQWRDSVSGSSTSGGIIPYASVRTGKGIQITGASPNSPTDNFDESTTNNPSLFTYNENNAGSATGIGNNSTNEDAGWTAATDGLGTITNGKGYRVLVRGDRSTSLKSSGSSFNPSNTTIQTRGGYITGTVNVQITNSGSNTNNGINLVGNPFPCAIDWETVHTASTNLDAAYVIWDVENLSYQSYTKGGSGAATRYIAPGQGFLVYCTATGGSKSTPATGTISFPQSAKTTANGNGGRFFQEIKNDHLIAVLRLDTTAADKSFIYFKKGATNYYDQFDAGHIQNNHANLASIDSTNTYYNVNCMDTLVGQRIIPLTLFGSPIGNYKMSFQDVSTFRNHDIFLIDNYTKKTTKIDEMSEYDIIVNTDKFSYTDGRLFLSFEPKASSSIIKIQKSNSFSIGPNPIKDNINVSSLNTNVSTVNYEISNINGLLIKVGTMDIKNDNIPTSFLSSGIYFITLTANNETQTIKFIK